MKKSSLYSLIILLSMSVYSTLGAESISDDSVDMVSGGNSATNKKSESIGSLDVLLPDNITIMDTKEVEVMENISCVACEKEALKVECIKEVKVVNYVNKCSGDCGFPVTVRANPICKNAKGM